MPRISGPTPAATAVKFAAFGDGTNPNADSPTGYRGFVIAPEGETGIGLLSANLAPRGKPGPLFWTPAEELPQGVYKYRFSQRDAFWVTPAEEPFHHFYILGDTNAVSIPAQGKRATPSKLVPINCKSA